MSFKKLRIKKVKIPLFSNIKGITSSEKFIVTFTGRRANIFNKNLELLYTIDDLYYVYNGYISPDESKILLVSTGNKFYIYSLNTFECLQKYSLKGRLNYNLEGQAAWDFNGENFLINASDKNTLTSCILYFTPNSLLPVKQIEFSNYRFLYLRKVDKLNKHLLVGSNLEDDHKHYLVFIDENIQNLEEYVIENFDDFITDVEYNQILNSIIVYGDNNSILCNCKGEYIKPIEVKDIVRDNSKFLTDWLCEMKLNKTDTLSILDKLFDFFEIDNLSSYENINKIVWSENFDLIYVATSHRFLIYDRKTEDIVFSKEVQFGVQDILEVCKDKVILSTWGKTLIYKILQMK
jgi:hypothetical protein